MNKKDQNPNRNNYDIQQFPYNPDSFKTFVQILLRLFHDPPAIVVGDCLIREQKSFTDKDLALKLNLSDRQVREALRQLEEDLVIIKDNKPNDVFGQGSGGSGSDPASSGKGQGGAASGSNVDNIESKYPVNQGGGGGGSGSSSLGFNTSIGLPSNKVGPSFYRINPHLPAVVEWQYNTIIHEIDQEIKDAVNLDELVCHRCNAKYSSLEALSLDLNPEDGLFLCRFCNEKLKSVDSASFRNAAKDKAERVRSQLQILSNSLELVKNMQVPIFPPYQSKNDAATSKTKLLGSLESNGDSSRRTPDDQGVKIINPSSNEASTPQSQDNVYSPYSSQSNINFSIKSQPSSIAGNFSSSPTSQTLPQHTVSKVKFGIKLSTKPANSSLLGASSSHNSKFAGGSNSFNFNAKRELLSSDTHSLAKTKISTESSSSSAAKADGGGGGNVSSLGPEEQPPPPHQQTHSSTKIEEPTFSVSAIKDKIFKITEIDDDVINQMTDSEYLKYDELLQKYQTLGLIIT